jgi:hypothetical protein
VADQFTGRDVTFWAVLALAAWGLAAAGGALGLFIPQGIFHGLHTSRLGGASLSELQDEVGALSAQTTDLKQQNSVLLQRLALGDEHAADVTKRVGALELQVPSLLEAAREAQTVDTTDVTAAIGNPVTTMSAEGGTVRYTTVPLPDADVPVSRPSAQPMPQALTAPTPEAGQFAVALGPPIEAGAADAAWQDITDKVGTLLIGLSPALGHVEGSSSRRLIAGPFGSEAEARALCGQMAKVGIACASVPFVGDPLN